MYQPFGDNQDNHEIDDYYIETGFQRVNQNVNELPTDILTGEMAKSVYLFQAEALEEKLQLAIDEARKDYYAVEMRKKGLKQTIVYTYVGIIALISIFCVWMVFLGSAQTTATITPMAISIVLFAGLVSTLFRKVFAQEVDYRIRSKKGMANRYVELYKIKTFQKEEDYYSMLMADLKKRLKRVQKMKEKVNKCVQLNAEEVACLQGRSMLYIKPMVYTVEHTSLLEYLKCR